MHCACFRKCTSVVVKVLKVVVESCFSHSLLGSRDFPGQEGMNVRPYLVGFSSWECLQHSFTPVSKSYVMAWANHYSYDLTPSVQLRGIVYPHYHPKTQKNYFLFWTTHTGKPKTIDVMKTTGVSWPNNELYGIYNKIKGVAQ